ncbi:MAG: T9SS type A sorting domain-containing protein [Gemmatimonadales bacterium]|nr:T9SS type A sorting domain-containing protein [Gemmatimonadales bacterium]
MNFLRRLPVLFAVVALAVIFTYGWSSFNDSDKLDSAQGDVSVWDQEIARLQNLQQHALPGSAEHFKYSHKINRIRADRDGRPHAENPDEFARILYERTVPADRDFPEYEPSYRIMERTKALANKSAAGTPLPWINRGPGNVAGRARGILVDPDDPTNDTWYFGSMGGGVWKTTDAGATWFDLTSDFPVLAVQSLAMAASNPDVIYAGTGESFYNVDTINGNGILKSTDRGVTWTHLASTMNNVDFNNIARIVVDPSDPDIVVCCATTGRYKESIAPASHIFKSIDGGLSWTTVYTESDLGTYDRVKKVQQVIADPFDFNKQYAAIDEKGILISTDAGDSWTLSNSGITDFYGRFELAISPANTDYVYASAEGSSHSELWVSTDGGLTWNETTETSTEPNWLGAQGWYDNTVVAHPTDVDVVFVGGIRLWRIDLLSGNRRTTTSLNQGNVHVDAHFLVVLYDGGGQWRLLNSNDGGVGVSGNSEFNWTAPKDGMITTQFYGVDKAPGRSAYIGGMQDNGTWHSPDNSTALDFWTFDIGGDGYETHWHFNDPLKIMGGYQFNGIQRSLDGGMSWSSAIGPIDYGSGSAPFITKIASSHESPDDVYAVGSSGVWHSSDFGASWALASISAPDWAAISSFTDVRVSQADADIVWAGARMDDTGRINVSANKGASFSPTTNFTDAVMGGISGLATHPTQPNTAYVLFSFAERPKILRTENMGATWTDISGFGTGSVSTNGFPDVAVYDLAVFPNDPNKIWVGTEIGLYESLDNGVTWAMAGNGLPAVGIWQMRIVEDQVVLATHGRGIWSVEIPALIVGSTFNPLIENLFQPPSGELAVDLNLRSAADSTQVWLNGSIHQVLPANAAKELIDLSIPVLTSGTKTIFVRSFIGGSGYDSESKSIDALSLPDPVIIYLNDFETSGDDFLGLGSGSFVVSGATGFAGDALHSPHWYLNGSTLIATLAQPIKVAQANALVEFDEVVLVEPGETGTVYGDGSFWDYVIVEGSIDGSTWVPLGPGYDSSSDPSWLSTYNSSGSGNDSLYRHRVFDLLDTFQWQDVVLLRFRLYADGGVTGWGWAVDNLSIQENSATAVDNDVPTSRFALAQNHPNPFNPITTINFSLPRASSASLKIFNLRGQLVSTLIEGTIAAGPHQAVWDGKDAGGRSVASGTYFYRLEAGDMVQQKKMLLLK